MEGCLKGRLVPKRSGAIPAISTNSLDDEYLASIFPNRPFGPIPEEGEDQQWNQLLFLFGGLPPKNWST
jgi:hypothetical protein